MSNLPQDSKARKEVPLVTGLLRYFPDALAEVAKVSFYGNEKHNPGEPLHWARDKSTDHLDCAGRHLLDAGGFDAPDFPGAPPQRHTAKLAWRALAELQVEIERDRGSVPYDTAPYDRAHEPWGRPDTEVPLNDLADGERIAD
jgi:hypothetical protein